MPNDSFSIFAQCIAMAVYPCNSMQRFSCCCVLIWLDMDRLHPILQAIRWYDKCPIVTEATQSTSKNRSHESNQTNTRYTTHMVQWNRVHELLRKNHTLKLRIPTISSQFLYFYRVFSFKLAHVVDTVAFKFECCKLLGFYIILQAKYVVYSYSDKRLTTPANAVLAWTLTRFVKRYTSAWG